MFVTVTDREIASTVTTPRMRGTRVVIMRGVLDDAYLPNGVRLRFPCGAEAPLFMVHGHPHNYLIWRKVAPDLARDQMVILPDMREATAINPRVSRGVSRGVPRSVAAELCFKVSNYFA